ncbi:hypothetical protein ABTH23_20610, partial [Acinetobacter baumannii]
AAELAEHDAIDYALVHASRFWRLNTSHVPAKVRTFIAYLVGIFSPSTPWEADRWQRSRFPRVQGWPKYSACPLAER